jgi:hypothetical protein
LSCLVYESRSPLCREIMDDICGHVYNLCMMLIMVRETDLNRIEVPDDYEVLDATALSKRLGFKRDTVLTYLSRGSFGRIPRPNRQLAMGPVWYEKSVREWEAKEEGATRGK